MLQPIPGGRQTTGVVVSYMADCSRGCTYEPTIRYTDLTGKVWRFTAPYQSEYASVGSVVEVSYDPRHPADAHDISVSTSTWDVPLATMIFLIALGSASAFGGGSLVVFAVVRRRGRTKAALLASSPVP